MSTTKKYLLENLCCPNCAAAIEREAKALDAVSAAAVDYETKTITVTFDGEESVVFKSISAIAVDIDEDIVTKAMN